MNAAQILALGLLTTLAACATRPKLPTRHFVPLSTEVQRWGALELDDRHLRLESFSGELRLEYAGRLPEIEDSDLSSASIYSVKNGTKYLARNAGVQKLCAEPPRWIAVASASGAPAWSGEIWVALLTLEDWRQFSGTPGQSCATGKYVLTSGETP